MNIRRLLIAGLTMMGLTSCIAVQIKEGSTWNMIILIWFFLVGIFLLYKETAK